MYARVTTFRGSPGASEEAVEEGLRILKEQVIPAAQEMRGFKGVVSVGDRTTGKAITLTLWETADAMRESEEAANRLREQAAQAMNEAVESVERYEVLVCDVRDAGGA